MEREKKQKKIATKTVVQSFTFIHSFILFHRTQVT